MAEVTEIGADIARHRPSAGYDLVGFIFTNRCNFACRHCCNESGTHKVAALETDELLGCVDDVARCDGIREIGISGGEPFLFPATLEAVIRHAAGRGLPSQVTTNAFWARTPAKADDLLGRLRDLGLCGLTISTSRFHLEFVRPERLVNAASAAVRLGLVTRVNYVTSGGFHLDDSRRIFGDLAGRLEFRPMPCIPTGRAAERVGAAEFEPRAGLPLGSCARFFKSLAVDFTGDVYPCCSPGGFTEPLRLGNIRDRDLGSILAELDDNLLIQVLRELGPTYFAPFVAERLGAAAVAGPFVDQCHFCHTIMSEPAPAEVVRTAVEQLRRDLAALRWDLAGLLDHAPA